MAIQAPERPTKLLAIDRCDSCGAPARVRATMASTGFDLLFCGHHANRHEEALRPQTSQWHDERPSLV